MQKITHLLVIIFDCAKFQKDLTCRFLDTLFQIFFLFNFLAHSYIRQMKTWLLETNRLAH